MKAAEMIAPKRANQKTITDRGIDLILRTKTAEKLRKIEAASALRSPTNVRSSKPLAASATSMLASSSFLAEIAMTTTAVKHMSMARISNLRIDSPKRWYAMTEIKNGLVYRKMNTMDSGAIVIARFVSV